MKRQRDKCEDLPRMYFHTYSTFDRPRRTKKLPHTLGGYVCRNIDYPNGILVDKAGVVQPLTPFTNATPVDDGSEDDAFYQQMKTEEENDSDFIPSTSSSEDESTTDETDAEKTTEEDDVSQNESSSDPEDRTGKQNEHPPKEEIGIEISQEEETSSKEEISLKKGISSKETSKETFKENPANASNQSSAEEQ